jgi:Zn-dependent M28 family amino/carboxypeptidase
MKQRFCFFLPLLFFPWASLAQLQHSESVERALEAIDAQKMQAHIKFLADDLLDGRGIGTRGSEIAIKYIAAQFESMGLMPGGENNTYIQRFPVIGIEADSITPLSFKLGNRQLELKYYEEFIAFPGKQIPEVSVKDAELVFVGYGIEAPEYKWNDYKDTDVTGKILLIMNNDPDNGDPDFFGGKARLYYGRWDYKYEMAARKGAAGAIIIHTTPSASYPWQVVQTSWSGQQFELPSDIGPRLSVLAWTSEDATRRILKMASRNLDTLWRAAQRPAFSPIPLGIRVSIAISNKIRNLSTANVLGLLPGSDPPKKGEVVVYTAHHDHLGIRKAIDGDSIYNGANDNASGVAAILEIAQAFAQLPEKPKRSILFISVAAEESGLLGSQYFAEHPTFKPAKIAADINLDGMNTLGRTRDITIVGFGKTTLDETVKEVAGQQQRVVVPDQFPEYGSFYRSDHFSFAKIGVPAISLDFGVDFIGRPKGWGEKQIEDWIDKHYHQPSDEYLPSWDLSGAVEDAQLAFLVGLKIATQNQMPQWMPGDEFEKMRK